ncbi:hypothetical protein K491DRAFT_666825 [Lophiostoma macrostomum CBS 122681]|uniref:Uncharacterized protein n=1 Tax=Lophiostoma macrostomum CBS 122681 TaxID=1314788 RepID=A0A6A6SVP8_9PLEO|nr:hypothetical protein K491DRAFT_666825 [Lophiostoma macrostomum CBS 122681]
MSHFDDEELSKIKATCFRGIARIQLTALNFDHPLVQRKHRSVSQKNVRRLRGIFEKVGCLRLQEENFINAIVDDASLDDALTLSGVSRDGLLCLREGQELPLLHLRVDCLSGLHRVEAAKAYLDDNDQWWVVRLFTNGTPKSVLSRIVELYSNEQRPADGEIFRKILLYRRLHDELSENQWWAYLDKSKPKDLRQLLKNQLLASAFGSLVDMPGLWAKLQLGALHRLLALKCVEEMLRYLHHIGKVWNTILKCGDTTLPYSAVDDVTADELEGLCPKYSASDRDYVSGLMQGGVIFPLVVDESLRRALLANICGVSSLIPSLWTFFETLKYLEPVCDILKRLIGNKMKGTIRRSLLGLFFPPERIRMQKSESHDMEWRAQSDQVQAAEIAYMELWAVCGRHFDGLTTFTPKKENGKGKPAIKEPNPVLWQCIARFALARGFRIPAAEQLAAQDSRSHLAIDYLRKANPLLVDFSAAQIQTAVLAGSTTDVSAEKEWQPSTTQLDVERRFGRPFASDLEVDKRSLFVPTIYRDQDPTAVNLLFVRRDLFRCIFGLFRFQVWLPTLPCSFSLMLYRMRTLVLHSYPS